MTDAFLPRPSPDYYDACECDSNGHLRGQDARPLINDSDHGGHGVEGGRYISKQGAGEKGEDPGTLMSNKQSSYPRAANPRPKPPLPVSCFIHCNDPH